MKKLNIKDKKQISYLQLFLTALFIVAFLVSNIIAFKQIQLPFGLSTTAGVILFPITYIVSDVFSEVYGYKYSRLTCMLAFVANIIMVLFFTIAIKLPYPIYFENNAEFSVVLSNSFKALVASLMAYVLGDLMNDLVFAKLKQKYQKSNKRYWFRSIVSSLFGHLTDSLIFIPIMFIGVMDFKHICTMIITNATVKLLYEIVFIPLGTLIVKKVQKHEDTLVKE